MDFRRDWNNCVAAHKNQIILSFDIRKKELHFSPISDVFSLIQPFSIGQFHLYMVFDSMVVTVNKRIYGERKFYSIVISNRGTENEMVPIVVYVHYTCIHQVHNTWRTFFTRM